jgi:hypothetical protein
LFHTECAHGIPSHSLSAPGLRRNELPKEWGAPCGTPGFGFHHGCLGRSVVRGSLSRASRVCTPHRPPPSPGFPVNMITTSLRQRAMARRHVAEDRRATIESTKPPLELPPPGVQHHRWPGARRATTYRLVIHPSAREPSRCLPPRSCLGSTLQEVAPLQGFASTFTRRLDIEDIHETSGRRCQLWVYIRSDVHRRASTVAQRPLELPPRVTSLELRRNVAASDVLWSI